MQGGCRGWAEKRDVTNVGKRTYRYTYAHRFFVIVNAAHWFDLHETWTDRSVSVVEIVGHHIVS